jgi:RimJ/RimL family protein N-acetyltransferase
MGDVCKHALTLKLQLATRKEAIMPSPGQIVSTFSTPAGEVILRYPKQGNAPALLEYINTVSREQTFILFQGEQLSLEHEEAWLRDRLAEIAAGTNVTLSAWSGNRVIGTTGIALKPLAERHVGAFGISVAADFRGLGIGTKMMESVIAEAEAHFAGLRIIELGVFANNDRAYRLYQKQGFVEFGRLPGGMLHRGEYVDHILMYKTVKRDDGGR